ncbi:MAG: nuclear transport factor 2 family protein [Ferruginibacter sp.]
MRLIYFIPVCFLSACSAPTGKENDAALVSENETKKELLSLERKWLEAEFKLDTAYIATLLDTDFISISADHISNKSEELKGMYDNISAMRRDSIFLDSMKFEDDMVNLYDNTAVVTFIVHTYKKNKGRPTEKRMRFYDIWINRNGKWKAVSAQGTVIEMNQ